MSYQPEWRNGREIGVGDRDCDERYRAIRDELKRHWTVVDRQRRVLDLGAYIGYFALRLVDDFPAARVVAVDDFPGLRRVRHARVNVITRRLSPDQVRDLGRFDAVLCLSVLHHVPRWDDLLDALLDATPLLFIESTSREENLPLAAAHTPELCDAVTALGGRKLTSTHGYKSAIPRELKVVTT